MRKRKPTAEELRVYNLIPVGRKNAIKRSDLKDIAGLSDRKVREYIENLTYSHLVVCNMGDGKGYFKPADSNEVEAYVKFLNAYKCTLQRRLYRLCAAAKDYAI